MCRLLYIQKQVNTLMWPRPQGNKRWKCEGDDLNLKVEKRSFYYSLPIAITVKIN